jgi:hypothetical protein
MRSPGRWRHATSWPRLAFTRAAGPRGDRVDVQRGLQYTAADKTSLPMDDILDDHDRRRQVIKATLAFLKAQLGVA